MTFDPSKLTPGPWECRACPTHIDDGELATCFAMRSESGAKIILKKDNLSFICLARRAFDVMMRRKWEAEVWLAEGQNSWAVDSAVEKLPDELEKTRWLDPFTALVAADKWYRENVENKQ